jgi:hypothetical protein
LAKGQIIADSPAGKSSNSTSTIVYKPQQAAGLNTCNSCIHFNNSYILMAEDNKEKQNCTLYFSRDTVAVKVPLYR